MSNFKKVWEVLLDAKLAFKGRRMVIDSALIDKVAQICGFTGNRRMRRKKSKRYIINLLVTVYEYVHLKNSLETFEVFEMPLTEFWDMIEKERNK